jgi:hypothetical protein
MHLLADPFVLFGVLKIVGAAIAFALAIPFIIGAIIGFLIGRAV